LKDVFGVFAEFGDASLKAQEFAKDIAEDERD